MKALQSIFQRVRKRPIPALAGVLVFLLVFFLTILFSGDPTWAYWLFGSTEKFRILEFVGVVMGGLLLVIGLVIADRRATAMADAATAQAKAARVHAKANKGAEDGRRQERLKNAIEHLGHASDSVRLGGAYELFHLAKDTEDLRQTVMDILCAHIRRTTGEREYRDKRKSKPSEEVQSLLTLLFVKDHDIFKGCSIDLQGSWLNGATLARARLKDANLHDAYLVDATLEKADMQGACLDRSCLSGSIMRESCLQRTKFSHSNLRGVDLFSARLEVANLRCAQMQGANLLGAYLQGAHIYGANLQGVTSKRSVSPCFAERIEKAIEQNSDLRGVIFEGGLKEERVYLSVKTLPTEEAERFIEDLEPHIDKPPSSNLPAGSKIFTGSYTTEQAAKWIAEYEKAVGKNPKATG